MADWKFKTNHVEADLETTDFVSSESVVLCYIPKTKDEAGTKLNLDSPTEWVPIGLVENITIQQRRALSELFEIGSKKQYQIPGRTSRRLGMSRILFNGNSLLKALTAGAGNPFPANNSPGATTSSKLFLNLASSFFDSPVNLGILIQDQGGVDADGVVTNPGGGTQYGAVALKDCYVESHNIALGAQQTVVMEAVSMSFSELIPVVAYEGESGEEGPDPESPEE